MPYIKINNQKFSDRLLFYLIWSLQIQLLNLKWKDKQIQDLLALFLLQFKYLAVFPLLIIQDSWFIKIIFTDFLKFFSNQNFRNTWNMNKRLTKSKIFAVYTVKRKPLIFKISFTSNISKINRISSLLYKLFH